MPSFTSKKFRPSATQSRLGTWYRRNLQRHPFALFGLPFIAIILGGSFILTPATAIRYERYDRKVKNLSKEDALGLAKDRRKVDMKEEYYVRPPKLILHITILTNHVRNWLPKTWTTGSNGG
jgi:cytochrome c oxidase assembly protein subunit 16